MAIADFGFTAYPWTESHMVSLHSELWATLYAGTSRTYIDPDTGPRLLFLLTGCVPTMLVLVLWQLAGYDRACGRPVPAGEVRHAGRPGTSRTSAHASGCLGRSPASCAAWSATTDCPLTSAIPVREMGVSATTSWGAARAVSPARCTVPVSDVAAGPTEVPCRR